MEYETKAYTVSNNPCVWVTAHCYVNFGIRVDISFLLIVSLGLIYSIAGSIALHSFSMNFLVKLIISMSMETIFDNEAELVKCSNARPSLQQSEILWCIYSGLLLLWISSLSALRI